MITLVKFLTVVGVIAGLAFIGIFALATFVQPKPHEITYTVPLDKMNH